MKVPLLLALLALVALSSATVFFKETFGDDYTSRWVTSDWKKSDGQAGTWTHTAGDWYGDKKEDQGIQTSQDARFYSISSKFNKFSNAGKDLVVQFQVKFPQNIDCGGGYIKILPSGFDQKTFNGDTPYNIMFGPDICGTSTRRVHVIFTFKGKNLLIKKEIRAETDQLSHVYTLIVHHDDSYEVRVDGTKRESGKLSDDWEFLLPRTIKDPSAKKPSDWVDEEQIDDPSDKKPADWDNVPKEIPDPDAKKPSDWDEDSDGKWEAPTVPNPEFKGDWKAKKIPNPAFKGVWKHPEIPNPDFVDSTDLYKYEDNAGVGIEIWQVKAGTIFDNIIVTDSVSEAESFLDSTWKAHKDAEKTMFDDAQKKKRDEEEAQRKKAEDEKKHKIGRAHV